ncbi:hypothetical protein [Jiella mangrovi]|uniref:Uncharacterized protein n=1 Tax=Jiella mangrovi TaxID=2821407 RepID=A0ABS4BKK0_9HYPH|nr:hypothetical protein [Jiella mangrovi]MBP0617234.1 hypothetical protein [Jiella mangrovi]
MIATALTFVFGFLTATLIALVVSPLFWSRSRRLALREYRASIPASAREIRASLDHVRAEAALTARRRELKAEADSEKAALARAEAGRIAGENAELLARNTVLSDTLSQTSADLDEVSERLVLREAEIDELEGQLRAVSHDLEVTSDELDALADRFSELGAIAEERRATIAEQEARIEELSDAVREGERDRREGGYAIERLQGELSALEAQLAKEKNAGKRLDDRLARLSEQLSERDDQIARLLGEAASAGARAAPSLAGPASGQEGRADDGTGGNRPLRLRPAMRSSFGRRSDEAPAPDADEKPEAPKPRAEADRPAKPSARAHQDAAALGAATLPEPAHPPVSAGRTEDSDGAKDASPSLAESLGVSAQPDLSADLSDAQLRERVGELAAQVIALTAARDGPRSPLGTILDTDASGPRDGARPSLAARVRQLRENARDQAAE